MALIEPITKLDTYKQYMDGIGKIPSYHLKQCFESGLPGAWLYMKAIGLEDVYFEVLNKAKKKSSWFKELFYLLLISNSNNKFYPKVPDDLLKIEIPPAFLDAQVPLQEPDFQMVCAFTRDQLKETIVQCALPNKMIRVGNYGKSVGVMYSDKVYCVYHADNPSALEFKSIDSCVDAVMRAMK